MKTKALLVRAACCLESDDKELNFWAREVIAELALRIHSGESRLSVQAENDLSDWYHKRMSEIQIGEEQ